MVMQMLQAGGIELFTDAVREADSDNPRGYFEHEYVKALNRAGDPSWLRDARGKAVKVISFLLEALPPAYQYRVLFLSRDLDEVLASQNRMLERMGEPPEVDVSRWKNRFRNHLRGVDRLLADAGHFERLDVVYREVLSRPEEQALRIRSFLGRPLHVDRMAAAVDVTLYRNRSTPHSRGGR